MKLPITCMQCIREGNANAMIATIVEFRDDGCYEIKCQKGHRSVTILQQQKFEVLFEIGAYAILDGYYREAVSSFTSALEKFYWFFSEVVCISKNIDWNKIQEAWKEISNQSERQLGAFIFIHLIETGNKPALLSNSNVKFRNEAIHKGKIPSKEEAINYGQAILDIVRPLIKKLRDEYEKAVVIATFQNLNKNKNLPDNSVIISGMSIPTILSLTVSEPGHDELRLEDAIAQLRRW